MPRYFFHYNDHIRHTDGVGTELASDRDAWGHGTSLCGELIRELSPEVPAGSEYRLECYEENGRSIFSINWAATALLQSDR